MRTFDLDFLNIINSGNFTMFFLLKLEYNTPLYITDFNHAIYHEGVKYEPVGFSLDKITGTADLSVGSVDIEIDDTLKQVSTILLTEDVRNKWGQLLFGVRDGATQKVATSFRGITDGWELTGENRARITLTNELILWNKKTLRIQSASCPWAYKGTECGYTGALGACDKSYAACQARSNEIHFGGDRFIAAAVTKEVWWGRTRNYTGT